MNLEGQFIAVVIIVASGLRMGDLLDGMIKGVAAAVVMIKIMMMTAADRHPIVIIVEMMIEEIMIERTIGEMIAGGEEVAATADAAVKDGVEVDPCPEVAAAHRL